MAIGQVAREHHYTFFDSKFGRLALMWSDDGIAGVQLPERNDKETVRRLAQRLGERPLKEVSPPPTVAKVIKMLAKHLDGGDTDLSAVKIDFAGVPPFHRKVYQAAQAIPSGVTVSYGQLAAAAGSPAAARAVGQAMARNPFPLLVPCHRVMGSDGSAVGFSAYGGCGLKERLLKLEGAQSQLTSRALGAQKKKSNGEATSSRRERRYGTADSGTKIKVATARRQRLKFDVDQAIGHISSCDKRMARLIEKVGHFKLELDEMLTPFEALAESIVYQQLTGKAAATIFSRVKAVYGGTRLPEPESIIKTPDATLRAAGLSGAKTAALKDLAKKQAEGLIPSLLQLDVMSDEEIIDHLTAVKGVGRWTVEMLLIFRLGRPDVLPVNDYGVRKGFARTFNLKDQLPSPRELAEYGEKWRPYRSVASWYLWRALEL